MKGITSILLLSSLLILGMSSCEKEDDTVKIEDYSSVIAESVDLGLSVKWASHNLGAKEPEGYGCYYAWGEIEKKSSYTWKNYRFRSSGETLTDVKFNKYNSKPNSGTVDSKTTLDLVDDVAHAKWGGEWRIPTPDEFRELLNNCTWTWTTQNGVNGYKVTSKKIGYENSSIFLPAAGFFAGESVGCTGSIGYYLTNSLNTASYAYTYEMIQLYISEKYHRNNSGFRDDGCSVRPVCP